MLRRLSRKGDKDKRVTDFQRPELRSEHHFEVDKGRFGNLGVPVCSPRRALSSAMEKSLQKANFLSMVFTPKVFSKLLLRGRAVPGTMQAMNNQDKPSRRHLANEV